MSGRYRCAAWADREAEFAEGADEALPSPRTSKSVITRPLSGSPFRCFINEPGPGQWQWRRDSGSITTGIHVPFLSQRCRCVRELQPSADVAVAGRERVDASFLPRKDRTAGSALQLVHFAHVVGAAILRGAEDLAGGIEGERAIGIAAVGAAWSSRRLRRLARALAAMQHRWVAWGRPRGWR